MKQKKRKHQQKTITEEAAKSLASGQLKLFKNAQHLSKKTYTRKVKHKKGSKIITDNGAFSLYFCGSTPKDPRCITRLRPVLFAR